MRQPLSVQSFFGKHVTSQEPVITEVRKGVPWLVKMIWVEVSTYTGLRKCPALMSVASFQRACASTHIHQHHRIVSVPDPLQWQAVSDFPILATFIELQ